jgi:hypothetical protein
MEEKVRDGAYATLLGLSVHTHHRARSCFTWRARAVGDSCLFLVRAEQLHFAFPVTRAADFGNQPHLLGARPAGRRCPRRRSKGQGRSADLLLMMTDALAQWFLCEIEDGRQPWRELTEVSSAAEFAELVDDLRQRRGLRNDDVTCLSVRPFRGEQP